MRAGLLTLVIALSFCAVYLLAILNLSQPIRLAGVFVLVGGLLFVNIARVELLAPLSLPVFALGLSEISMPPFIPTVATFAGICFTVFWVLEKITWDLPFTATSLRPFKIAFVALALQVGSIVVSISTLGQPFWNAVRDGSSLFLFLPAGMIIAEQSATEEGFQRLLHASILTLLMVGSLGILQYFGTAGFYRNDLSIGYVFKARVGSSFPSANVLAGYLELFVPVALSQAISGKGRLWGWISLAAFVTGFLSALYTFSRGGFFLTIGASAFVLLHRYWRKPILLIAVFIGFVIVIGSSADTFARQLSLVTNPSDIVTQPTLVHRYLTYQSFIEQFQERPITGIGWGAEEFYWGRTALYTFWDVRHRVSRTDIDHFGGLNSAILNCAVKGGIISLASLACLALAGILAAKSLLRRRKGLLTVAMAAGMAALMGHQFVDNLIRWPQMNAFMWIFLGMMAGMPGDERQPSGEGLHS